MSKSNNYGLPESFGKSFPHEDDVPRLDCGNGNHSSLSPPPPIILPDPHVRRLEKFKVTQALLARKHEAGRSVCAHVLEIKSHIGRLGMLGVVVSRKLVVDLVLQSLPKSYSEFIKDYYMMDHDVTQPSMGNGNIGSPEKSSLTNRKGSTMVKSFEQMVKRNAKS